MGAPSSALVDRPGPRGHDPLPHEGRASIEADDERVMKGLAEAYAAYARRNVHKPKEPQGLRGRIVGYADPRRSAGPDNQALSEQRADGTGGTSCATSCARAA